MTNKEKLIQIFYTGFQNKDYKTMQDSYHSEAKFYDPVFKELNADEVRAMWQMLCERGKDLKLSFSDIKEENGEVSCKWEAKYSFSKTGRKVHNRILATFTFKDGKILTHKDEFNFWKWSAMAFGISGILMGWTPFLQNKVGLNAKRSLKKFMYINNSLGSLKDKD